jgi:hypothetical protein
MRWVGRVMRVGTEEAYTEFWWGNLKERHHLREVEWWIIDWMDLSYNRCRRRTVFSAMMKLPAP